MDERNRTEGYYPELFPEDFGERLERLLELVGLVVGGVRRAPWRKARPSDGVARGYDTHRRGGVAHHTSGAVPSWRHGRDASRGHRGRRVAT